MPFFLLKSNCYMPFFFSIKILFKKKKIEEEKSAPSPFCHGGGSFSNNLTQFFFFFDLRFRDLEKTSNKLILIFQPMTKKSVSLNSRVRCCSKFFWWFLWLKSTYTPKISCRIIFLASSPPCPLSLDTCWRGEGLLFLLMVCWCLWMCCFVLVFFFFFVGEWNKNKKQKIKN